MDKREFNPREHLTEITIHKEDGTTEKKIVLKATARTTWFRSRYPEGRISYRIDREGKDIYGQPVVRVECRVYARATDDVEHFLANGFATRSFATESIITRHYLESCQTAAKIRALQDAGFSLMDEDDGLREDETTETKNPVDAAFVEDFGKRETDGRPCYAPEEKNYTERLYKRKLDEADFDPSEEMAAAGLIPSTATGQTVFFPEAKERPENVLTDNIVSQVQAEEPVMDSHSSPDAPVAAPKSRRKKPSLLTADDDADSPKAPSDVPAEDEKPVEAKTKTKKAKAQPEADFTNVEEPVSAKPEEPVVEEKPETTEAPTIIEEPVVEEVAPAAPAAPAAQPTTMDYKAASKVVINEIASNPNFKGKTLDEIIHMDDENACKMFLNWAAAQNPAEYSEAAAAEIVAAKVVLAALI